MTVLYSLSYINKSLQWSWFAEEMKKRGIQQVYVLVEADEGVKNFFHEELLQMGIPVYTMKHTGWMSYLKNIRHTCRIIRKHQPDIIHTSLPLGNLVGLLAAWMERKKKPDHHL